MKVFYSSADARHFCKSGSAITMGNFDGLHTGHQWILKRLENEARKRHCPSIVYTFHPHPVQILAPHSAPPLINLLEQKIELISSLGINALVVEKFDRRFAHHSPEDFFETFLQKRLHAKFVTVGYDFTFGARRKGNVEALQRLCFEKQVDILIIPPFLKGETLVSSSLIRKYILEGMVKRVIPLLGRPFFLDGHVVHGEKRGRRLGFPTLNLETANELLPREGVYATRTLLGKKIYGSVTNIGHGPTFGGKKLKIETSVFGFNKKAYHRQIRLYFLSRIRDEIKFKTADQLMVQIRRDEAQARKIINR